MGVESETTAKGRRLGRNPEGAKRVEGRVSSHNHTNVAAAPCGSLHTLSGGDISTDPFFGPRPFAIVRGLPMPEPVTPLAAGRVRREDLFQILAGPDAEQALGMV